MQDSVYIALVLLKKYFLRFTTFVFFDTIYQNNIEQKSRMKESEKVLANLLKDKQISYNELVISLQKDVK